MPRNVKGTYGYIPWAPGVASMGRFSPNISAGIYARVEGTRDLEKKLNLKFMKIKSLSLAGLRAGAAYIRGDMERTSPLIPIGPTAAEARKKGRRPGTGALRASWFVETDPASTLDAPLVMAGFGSSEVNYAVYVHEMTVPPYTHVDWSRPGSGPKFLEYALKRNIPQVIKIVTEYAKKGI
jgi:hypothetical protein